MPHPLLRISLNTSLTFMVVNPRIAGTVYLFPDNRHAARSFVGQLSTCHVAVYDSARTRSMVAINSSVVTHHSNFVVTVLPEAHMVVAGDQDSRHADIGVSKQQVSLPLFSSANSRQQIHLLLLRHGYDLRPLVAVDKLEFHTQFFFDQPHIVSSHAMVYAVFGDPFEGGKIRVGGNADHRVIAQPLALICCQIKFSSHPGDAIEQEGQQACCVE